MVPTCAEGRVRARNRRRTCEPVLPLRRAAAGAAPPRWRGVDVLKGRKCGRMAALLQQLARADAASVQHPGPAGASLGGPSSCAARRLAETPASLPTQSPGWRPYLARVIS